MKADGVTTTRVLDLTEQAGNYNTILLEIKL
jgi:hypothetical protein